MASILNRIDAIFIYIFLLKITVPIYLNWPLSDQIIFAFTISSSHQNILAGFIAL